MWILVYLCLLLSSVAVSDGVRLGERRRWPSSAFLQPFLSRSSLSGRWSSFPSRLERTSSILRLLEVPEKEEETEADLSPPSSASDLSPPLNFSIQQMIADNPQFVSPTPSRPTPPPPSPLKPLIKAVYGLAEGITKLANAVKNLAGFLEVLDGSATGRTEHMKPIAIEMGVKLRELTDKLILGESLLTGVEIPEGGPMVPLPVTDIRNSSRNITIITTAALPWMTGTAVNPLLRAAFLTRGRKKGQVSLLVPWLEKHQQQSKVYPKGVTFDSQEEQREFILNWLRESGDMREEAESLDLMFYNGSYHSEYRSIFPIGDIIKLVPDDHADVCVLEEPEHLNWYRAVDPDVPPFQKKFRHVVGVIHTNYVEYARTQRELGYLASPILFYVNNFLVRCYCDRIIKLSDTLQDFAKEKETTCNVHGVRNDFLKVGDRAQRVGFSKGAYFLGKAIWAKGQRQLIEFLSKYRDRKGESVEIDVFGNGDDFEEISDLAKEMNVRASMRPGTDHAECGEYKLFVNPSTSEVLCTTTAEALAMGKFVLIPKHPSNTFFEKFSNCLTYETEEEFFEKLEFALKNDPAILKPEERYAFSWEAACERFAQAALVPKHLAWYFRGVIDSGLNTYIHKRFMSGEVGDWMRFIGGAEPAVAVQTGTKTQKAIKALWLAKVAVPKVVAEVQTSFEVFRDDLERSASRSSVTWTLPKDWAGLQGLKRGGDNGTEEWWGAPPSKFDFDFDFDFFKRLQALVEESEKEALDEGESLRWLLGWKGDEATGKSGVSSSRVTADGLNGKERSEAVEQHQGRGVEEEGQGAAQDDPPKEVLDRLLESLYKEGGGETGRSKVKRKDLSEKRARQETAGTGGGRPPS
uniref:digalactosyldiacylglycerol synthase n=1 Tax=Chromera velia CCMP2878 TaxID=1169474 RepID=A0A0G4HM89_9ALVE|eukprot:Cvel_7453.t1-p1 / transcript=Cvel_7453.t1 / gene=Cvel_7453 / organism=Chromera_velia_CCMP2878 / gene_product=Digalactosyldiacylglycerol synthase 1,, putative / transcript_product=Digalactosyldiacylglycerol synthase 1,, putative / location=Cvel_scaffold390:12195-18284(+) / protein_length=862 / sequence_SO=supercontig / SO=protein_coding / is_pseudo=false